MYNIHIHGTQSLWGSRVTVSISETDEYNVTTPLTGLSTVSCDGFDGLEAGSLEEFLEQVITASVNTLSANAAML